MNTYCYHLIRLNTFLSIFIYLNKTTLSKLNMIKSQTVNFLLNVLITTSGTDLFVMEKTTQNKLWQ